jgi:NitT/TauT family transport system permease protein
LNLVREVRLQSGTSVSATAGLKAIAAKTAPWLFGLAVLVFWEMITRLNNVPPYVLPGPLAIVESFRKDAPELLRALSFTLRVTVLAFLAAAVGGLVIGLLMASSRIVERTLLPYAVILQVTPIVAIAPLIIIWTDDIQTALLVCAVLVAFFPVLSNTVVGLHSIDPNLSDLFKLYGLSTWQTLFYLKLPSSLPFYLAGLRIAGGLALIGAVVAEFVAGTGGRASGLAYSILDSGFKLQVPRMFACLVLIALVGIAIYISLSIFSRFLLRNWHDSAAPRR